MTYVAIGGDDFAAKARQFPGVLWVQKREGVHKVSKSLQSFLQRVVRDFQSLREAGHSIRNASRASIVAECWLEGCISAAALVQTICPHVYLHPSLLEVRCRIGSLRAAVAALANHVGINQILKKTKKRAHNFGGRAIIGGGPLNTDPINSKVLDISVSNSIIGVADTGIDMKNCFFYDSVSPSPSTGTHRNILSYEVNPCEICGTCCDDDSPVSCKNSDNKCGNYIDESGHGTHVSGTIAGSGPSSVSYGNGIAKGAKLYFTDMENMLSNDKCYYEDSCDGLNTPLDLMNLFQPAFNSGVRVHSNSWGCYAEEAGECNYYGIDDKNIDSFVSANPSFLVLIAAGNDGSLGFKGTISSPAVCKNCLSVGASQQSDELFRSMKPFVDPGQFCESAGGIISAAQEPCCNDYLKCVNKCCQFTSILKMSLPCCEFQTTCGGSLCSVAAGNILSPLNVASFSSRGPCAGDGRIKPDLVAPGENILSAFTPGKVDGKMVSTTTNFCGVPSQSIARTISDNNNRALQLMSGTSMATPLSAGAVEKIRQYFVQGYYPQGIKGSGIGFSPDEALIRAVILASCSPLSDASVGGGVMSDDGPYLDGFFRFPIPPMSSAPDIFAGFGLPVLDRSVFMSGSNNGYRMYYNSATYSSVSNATAFDVSCDSLSSIPVTIVLVWNDPPGSTAANKQLVNDLDLIVIVPGASPSQLFGNMRSFADQVNTVERIVVSCPAGGLIKAVVALRNPLKTLSQKWYIVSNGPITQAPTTTTLPMYSSGRITPPSTSIVSCVSQDSIHVRLRFKAGSAWVCSSAVSSWDCSLKGQNFVMSLAQLTRVDGLAVELDDINIHGIDLSLSCSIVINSMTNSVATLQYISATTLLNSIRYFCNSTGALTFSTGCQTDPYLSGFEWPSMVTFLPSTKSNAAFLTMHRFAILLVGSVFLKSSYF